MTKYIKFELEDGSALYVEVEESSDYGLVDASRDEELVQKAERRFEEAIDSAKTAADTLLNKIKSLSEQPDEVEITFGLKASGELGGNFFVAKAGLEANYSVKLTWKKDPDVDSK